MPDSIHVHRLEGCRSTPLAHYLKSLGVLRLVAQQADPNARGWWQDDVFHLSTLLDREALAAFFLHDYQPTPILAPWNGGSGFFPKDNKSGIRPIAESVADRFAPYQEAIAIAAGVVAHLDAKPDKGEAKNGVILQCRKNWRGSARDWIDAAVTLDDKAEPSFPAMLGTGGNDGRLDFTSNFMQRLVSLFDMASEAGDPFPKTQRLLEESLWSTQASVLENAAIGQFLPRSTAGPNGSTGFEGGVAVNAWDFILMLEGATAFRAGVARRCSANSLPQASAPFAVRSSGAGYASANSADEGARGEQWMPLWTKPATYREVADLFLRGRSQIGRQRVARSADMARAIARQGVATGIGQFERYGYIERNGLANLAVPLGRFQVVARPHQNLLDEVAPWIDRLRRIANAKNAPESFARAHRACEEAVFSCTERASGEAFLSLLETMARAEDLYVLSPKHAVDNYAQPISRTNPSTEKPDLLSFRWLQVVETDSSEFRLARALASQSGKLKSTGHPVPVRHHWLPLVRNRFRTGEGGMQISPDQCATGLDLQRALIALVDRRLIAMSQGASRGLLPLNANNPANCASLQDIHDFLDRRTNDARLLRIARALMAVDLTGDESSTTPSQPSCEPLGGLAMYGVLRLAMSTQTVAVGSGQKVSVRCNPTVFHRLRHGDVSGAIRMGTRQLTAVGLRPRIGSAIGSSAYATRLAASIGFAISRRDISRLAFSLTQPQTKPPVEATT